MDHDLNALRQGMAHHLEEAEKKSAEIMRAKATYKIQIWFRHNRRLFGDNQFTLSFWESGKRLHGGGDEKMFVCRRLRSAPKPNRRDAIGLMNKGDVKERGCDHLIPGALVSMGLVVCPHCGMRHDSAYLVDSVLYEMDMTKASEILEMWWRRLDGDADVYVKFAPDDPRTLVMADEMGFRKARRRKGLTIYPLAHIIKDISNGASVQSRFRSLLTA